MKKRIAIAGSTGRLGRALVRACAERYDVIALRRRDLDLSWPDARIAEAVSRLNPDLLLLAAGLTDVDYCESHPEIAEQLNVTSVRQLAATCAEKGIRLINFSTDYVFDGESSQPYREDDPAHPLSVYGKSKLDGETATLEAGERNLVIRLCWLFGPGEARATPDWVIDLAVSDEAVGVVKERISTPSYTCHIAAAIENILFNDHATGILHLSNSGQCSWQEWAQFCIDCAIENGIEVRATRVDGIEMEEVFQNTARRPRFTVLSTERFHQLADLTLPPWQDGVREYIRETVAPRFRETDQ